MNGGEERLKKNFYSKEFWLRYFWILQDDFSYELLDKPIEFLLPNGFCLYLDTGSDLSYIYLSFKHNQEVFEVAWDDEAQWHPFVFRFDEFIIVTKMISEINNLEEWLTRLLFIRFVGSDNKSEEDRMYKLKIDMLYESGLFSKQDLKEFDEKNKREHTDNIDAKWVFDSLKGWIYEGLDAYSLRNSQNTEFPFSLWNGMIEQCSE